MNTILYNIFRFEDFVFNRKHLVHFFFTQKGLKNIGAARLLGAKPLTSHEVVELSAGELFLGPDYLTDNYTLLGCNIEESPHFGLMQALMDGQSIWETDYIRRYLDGTLDWRRGSLRPKNSNKFHDKFTNSKKAILSGNTLPVVVYSMGGRYYIYDGKHRAALCTLLGLPIKCSIVGNEIANADLWHYMFNLIEDNNSYTQHAQFHGLYLRQLKSNERK